MDRKLAGKIAMVDEIYGRHRLCDRQFTCRSKGEIEKEFFEHAKTISAEVLATVDEVAALAT